MEKKEFDINEVEFVVIRAIKGKIKLNIGKKVFIDLDKQIHKAVKEYHLLKKDCEKIK